MEWSNAVKLSHLWVQSGGLKKNNSVFLSQDSCRNRYISYWSLSSSRCALLGLKFWYLEISEHIWELCGYKIAATCNLYTSMVTNQSSNLWSQTDDRCGLRLQTCSFTLSCVLTQSNTTTQIIESTSQITTILKPNCIMMQHALKKTQWVTRLPKHIEIHIIYKID